jgi:ribonucleoside-diphosphate reductase alpha chain
MTARRRLPNRRSSTTFAFEVSGLRYTATASYFEDGQLAEIFLGNHKSGSMADNNARDAAPCCSIALQYGAPADVIRRALMRDSQGKATGPLDEALNILLQPPGAS